MKIPRLQIYFFQIVGQYFRTIYIVSVKLQMNSQRVSMKNWLPIKNQIYMWKFPLPKSHNSKMGPWNFKLGVIVSGKLKEHKYMVMKFVNYVTLRAFRHDFKPFSTFGQDLSCAIFVEFLWNFYQMCVLLH